MAEVGAVETTGAIQWLLDFVAGALIAAIGFIVRAMQQDHRDLVQRHDDLERSLPETYARRDDVKDGLARVEAQQAAILAKLDRLVERS